MSRSSGSFPEEADHAALDDFHARYGAVSLAPVVVVIAAYNEGNCIGPVIDAIPVDSCSLPVAPLVVVDGAPDHTAATAREHGAYVCEAPANRGQGAALRLGYHIAREAGADYIVTTDADGQYDIDGLPTLLKPLIADEADFVSGSRILGQQESNDLVRRLGVYVFAWLASAFTRQCVTDTSFGFRAMKAEVTGAVTLSQPQYQSSELLIGALSRGYRLREKPMTMRLRAKGTTKKGNNLIYGANYARVICGTWLRERRAARQRAIRLRQAQADRNTEGTNAAGR